MELKDLKAKLHRCGSKKRAKICASFFKTGPGEYGEGDVFIGVAVPPIRKLAGEAADLGYPEVKQLLKSPVHEERLLALIILVQRFQGASAGERKKIFELYLRHTRCINNWDLVDVSAPQIVGGYLLEKDKAVLYRLVRSKSLWERRTAMLATYEFIKHDSFVDALAIAERLLADREDLIHKAAGWMLREVGKRSLGSEEAFLKRHAGVMPRVMLRYAIEKFPEGKRRWYLGKKQV